MSDNSSSFSASFDCSNSTQSYLILIAYSITRVILISPLCFFVLYLGLQRWKKKGSFAAESHSDIFTYNVILSIFIRAFEVVSLLCSLFTNQPNLMIVALCLYTTAFFVENLFHVLTCVERYLAVVHPHTYMGLRNVRGVRIRNLSVGGSWLLSFLCGALSYLGLSLVSSLSLSILTFSLAGVSYCSVSVLCVLVRPMPGDERKYRERVDPVKHRAFLTIMAIWGVLSLWFSGLLISYSLHRSQLIGYEASCAVMSFAEWTGLPSNLLLPLLYLQRAGKLSCFCTSISR